MIKKIIFSILALTTITQLEAVRYGKKTGTKLTQTVEEFSTNVQDTYGDSFDAVKKLDNRKISKSEKRTAQRALVKKAQATKLKFGFLSNLFAYEENEALKDHPFVAYVELLGSCINKSKKYIRRLEKLKKDATRELKRKKISKDNKTVFAKLTKDADRLLTKVKDLKEHLLDLDEVIQSTDEFREDKRSYGNTLRVVKLNKTIRNNSNRIILHGCHCNCWTCWFNC